MQPKVNAVHGFLSLCISERGQRKSSLKAGNFAAPKKVATFHIEFVLIQDVPLTRSTWLTCGVLAGARSQFCDPAAAAATLNFKLITSFREKLATRRCGRWGKTRPFAGPRVKVLSGVFWNNRRDVLRRLPLPRQP